MNTNWLTNYEISNLQFLLISLFVFTYMAGVYRRSDLVQFIRFVQKHKNRKHFTTLKYTSAFPFFVALSVLRLARSWRVRGSCPNRGKVSPTRPD